MKEPVRQAIQALAAHLENHQRYLLTTHVGPDGDGLGSALALSAALRARGREATVVIVDPLPTKFAFMLEGFPEGTLRSYPQEVGAEELGDFDTVVLLDCGSFKRLGPLLDAVPLEQLSTICIDHHISSEAPAELMILDEEATSTANLIHAVFEEWGLEIGQPEAVALYVALMTETGSFRFSNTTPEVHRLVADLMEKGIRPHDVYVALYENKPHPALVLGGHGLANLQVGAGGKLVYTVISREVFERYRAVPEDADGLVNQILALEGAEVAVLIYDRGGGQVKVSFRAKNDVDVQKLAAELGGGGHRKAAGATLCEPLDEVTGRVVALAEAAIEG